MINIEELANTVSLFNGKRNACFKVQMKPRLTTWTSKCKYARLHVGTTIGNKPLCIMYTQLLMATEIANIEGAITFDIIATLTISAT